VSSEEKTRTHTSIVVDRTGSMDKIKDEAEQGVRGYVEALRKFKGTISLYQFDKHIKPGHEAPFLEHLYTAKTKDEPKYVLLPRGSTPLYDAVALTILETRKTIEGLKKKPDKIALVIMTDGGENCSREHDFAAVSALIKEAQDRDGWRIEFLAGSLESQTFARTSGLKANTTRAFNPRNKGETIAVYGASTRATMDFYEGKPEPAQDANTK
jgi:hypothetical protein